MAKATKVTKATSPKTAAGATGKTTGKAAGKTVAKALPSRGKSVARKKRGLTEAVIVLAVIIAVIAAWQWDRASLSPSVPPGEGSATEAGTSQTAPSRGGETGTAPGESGGEEAGPVIGVVRITPARPVTTDAITAVALLAGGDAGGVEFAYQWKLNGRIIPGATTSVLKDSSLKRGDRVSVEVRARRHGMTSPPVESQVVISNPPPSLEMKIMTPRVLPGKPFEIQLTTGRTKGKGEEHVFSLEPPLLEGMTIDGPTGKIVWTPARLYTGKVLFGAAVTDGDGNSAGRVFELDMGAAPGPVPEPRP